MLQVPRPQRGTEGHSLLNCFQVQETILSTLLDQTSVPCLCTRAALFFIFIFFDSTAIVTIHFQCIEQNSLYVLMKKFLLCCCQDSGLISPCVFFPFALFLSLPCAIIAHLFLHYIYPSVTETVLKFLLCATQYFIVF